MTEPTAVNEGTDFGERVDLFAAYSNPPPPRDDVLLGLEAGNVMAIGAPGGGSKTFFLLGLAHDLAFGGTVNSMRTTLVADRKQCVGILTAEESVAELARRVHAVGFALNDDQRRHAAEYIDVRSVRREIPILIDRDGSVNKKTVEQITLFADGKRAVGLDPLGRFCRADKNDEDVMLLLVTTLEQIAQKVGCIFMLPHHVGKAAILSGNGDSALALKGSTALIDACRMAMMIFRPSKKIAGERKLGVAWRHRIVKTDKANHRADKGEVWFRVRDDGTLEYDELQNAWQPKDLVNDGVAAIGSSVENVTPVQGRMHDIVQADGDEDPFETKQASARAAFFGGAK